LPAAPILRHASGDTPEAKTSDNPVDEHMQLAVDFNVKGTPMIVTEKGNIYPG
jgi:thiol:disulfide interchange protein DsbC